MCRHQAGVHRPEDDTSRRLILPTYILIHMADQHYALSHPQYEELDVPHPALHAVRLVVPDIGYASASLEWVSNSQVMRWMGAHLADVSVDSEVHRIREIITNTDAYHWVVLLDGRAIGEPTHYITYKMTTPPQYW